MSRKETPRRDDTPRMSGRCYDDGTMRRHVLRFFAVLLALGVVAAIVVAIGARVMVGRSLPTVDGSLTLAGLAAPVTVARDELGIPTITAQSRVDLARSVGFVHAQERFFQMDLQRRQPAGELSALVGAAALTADRAVRVHRFRTSRAWRSPRRRKTTGRNSRPTPEVSTRASPRSPRRPSSI